MSAYLRLENGLTAVASDALSDLVAEIAGQPLSAPPVLAPALLLSAPEVRSAWSLPKPAAGSVLIHDYQSIAYKGPISPNRQVEVQVDVAEKGATTEIETRIDGSTRMVTSLRMVTELELAAAQPMAARVETLEVTPALWTISPDHVARYLDLSGDTNVLHRQPAPGLGAPAVPGLLLLGLVQPALDAWRPGALITGLRGRFAAPVPVGAAVRIGLQMRGPDRVRAFVLTEAGAVAVADLTLGAMG